MKANKLQKLGAILAVVAFIMGTTQVYAMTENWGAVNTRFLTGIGGTTGIAVGSLIEIGTVNNPAAAASAFTPAQLQATMNVWATSTVGSGSGIAGSFSVASIAPGTGFFNFQIYLLAFNAPTPGAATLMGMFTDTSWIFPASNAAPANSLDLSDAGLTAVNGSLSNGTVISPAEIAGGDAAVLFIPEPSTWSLVGTSLLGLLAFRRRS